MVDGALIRPPMRLPPPVVKSRLAGPNQNAPLGRSVIGPRDSNVWRKWSTRHAIRPALRDRRRGISSPRCSGRRAIRAAFVQRLAGTRISLFWNRCSQYGLSREVPACARPPHSGEHSSSGRAVRSLCDLRTGHASGMHLRDGDSARCIQNRFESWDGSVSGQRHIPVDRNEIACLALTAIIQ